MPLGRSGVFFYYACFRVRCPGRLAPLAARGEFFRDFQRRPLIVVSSRATIGTRDLGFARRRAGRIGESDSRSVQRLGIKTERSRLRLPAVIIEIASLAAAVKRNLP